MSTSYRHGDESQRRLSLEKSLEELRRKPDDEDLVVIAKEWARDTWGMTDGKFYFRDGISEGQAYPSTLLVDPEEVRIATQAFLRCLQARRKYHSRFIDSRMASIVAKSEPDVGEKVLACHFLRHACPFGIRPKVPVKDRDASVTSFKWAWMPLSDDCPFESLLSDLSIPPESLGRRDPESGLDPSLSYDEYRTIEGLFVYRTGADSEDAGRGWLCGKSFLRDENMEVLEHIHDVWAGLGPSDILQCEDEFLRTPTDEDLVSIVKDLSMMIWTLPRGGQSFYFTHMKSHLPYREALPVSIREIKETARAYLSCLAERRTFHSAFIQPKIRAIMAQTGLSPHDKIEQCLILRSRSPLAIEARVPFYEDGRLTFRYIWGGARRTVMDVILSDLAVEPIGP
ncbi:hypothetical protein DFP72DRAFT_1064764 [Ephemerocybe angulata]|uniref:Uncharacterized protein n=1 Tax=Ephemerocybe angulata TaxID=980116 RepID=A0A8H6I7A7_9AGAR|nr:hypothetical protein DFP72DRAFT_1064764 [Tulosesus angulatus]